MLSDSCKNHILCNYDFELFDIDIHNMNKTHYRNFNRHTESKSSFILAGDRNTSKTNTILDTKKSKDNSTGAANAVNNKAKDFSQNKKYQ